MNFLQELHIFQKDIDSSFPKWCSTKKLRIKFKETGFTFQKLRSKNTINDRQMRMMKKKVDGGQSRVIYESINQTLWGCLKGKSEKYRCGHSWRGLQPITLARFDILLATKFSCLLNYRLTVPFLRGPQTNHRCFGLFFPSYRFAPM